MASKVITISLPEALEWKLEQLNKRTGIPKSALVSKALLLLITRFEILPSPEINLEDLALEKIEQEYAHKEV